jgi:type II secretory pathway predicted ATPase ExeA
MTTSAGLVSPAKIFSRSTDGATWVGRKQQDALDHLLSKRPVKLLLGPSSSGKSSILRLLEQQAADDGIVLLRAFGPQRSALDVLTRLLTAADLGLWTLSEIEQRNLLTVFIEQRSLQGSRVAICVDDVSEFSAEAWSEIERLIQLRHAGEPLIELIVVATERDASRAPLYRFVQNGHMCPTNAIHFLSAPDGHDLESYVSWRLARFGIRSTFTAGACAAIASQARGRFNSVNVICQSLFLNRRSERPSVIDELAVAAAVSKLAGLKGPAGPASNEHASTTPAAWLVVLVDGKPGFEIALSGPTVIGRSDDADLRLTSRRVSRRHAAIVPAMNGRYAISDLDSTNGVLVNGKFVKRTVLKHGDVLDLCEFRVRFELRSAAAVASSVQLPFGTDDDDTDVMPAPDLHFESALEARGS